MCCLSSFWRRKSESSEKFIDLPKFIHWLYHIKMFRVPVLNTLGRNKARPYCYIIQWFLEQVENVNIKHYIKHLSPWQWYGYYFNSANFLANFIWRRLSMFKYDKNITNSLIITKYINKTYQHKNKCLLLTARFQKGR
jgi:hypothetical protein